MKGSRTGTRCASAAAAFILGTGAFVATARLEAKQQAASSATCRVSGVITGLGAPLPGVSVTVRKGDVVQSATSTDLDGNFRLPLPDGTYQVALDLTGFTRVEREVTVSKETACTPTVDATLALLPRTAVVASAGRGGRAAGARAGGAGAAGGRGAAEGFETLAVTENAATASLDVAALERSGLIEQTGPAPNLLPSGFGSEALADAVAFNGEAARVDRSVLNERQGAINRGDFQPFGEDGRQGGQGRGNQFALAGAGGFGADGGGGGNFQFEGGRGRGGNNNQQQLGGRGVSQRRVQGTVQFGYSGSALNQAPLQLRSEVRGTEKPNSRQTFSATVQAPIRIPFLDRTNPNGSTLQFQYSGNRGASLYDQYATVPSAAMRVGDFSEIPFSLIDPQTGQPFPGNVIPPDRISQQALALAPYYPAANLPGTTRNYHIQDTQGSPQNSFQVRLQHNFTGQAANGGGGGGGRGGGGGGGNTNGGRGGQQRSNSGQAGQGRRLLGTRTNVNMNLQVSYANNDSDVRNVFDALGGVRNQKTLGINDSFNIQRGRVQQTFSVQFNKADNQTKNHFTGLYSPAAQAGIEGISQDPFSYGLPRVSFSSMTGLTDTTPSLSATERASTSYSYTHPFGRNHSMKAGATFDWNRSVNNTEQNPNGTFTFTGLYTSGGLAQQGGAGRLGFDYADFLLGMPQQATVQYGPGATTLRGQTMGLYIQDDWRMRSNMTVQFGVRYDLLWPYVEEHDRLVNLDVTPDFTAAAPVQSGETGEFSGAFPKSLVHADRNNVSPQVGLAWRAPGGMTVRPSWAMKFNNGNQFSSVANQMAKQPPFATTNTNIGTVQTALLMENALLGSTADQVTNTYGIDENYVLGKVNQFNVDVQRPLGRTFQVSANYSHTIGSSLDVTRAPNRNPDGTIRIDGVQPFYWTSSEGRSELNSATFRLEKRQSGGIGWQVEYTIAKSHDNAPSGTGGGAGSPSAQNVAQNDQDINAEWGLSNFDQRHALSASTSIQLPWGQDRKWLNNGGTAAAILGGWSTSVNFNWRSGRPYTVSVSGASRDISTGISGALRANYDGEPIAVADPTIDKWFNTSAFSIPPVGSYGTSPRNVLFGPGSKNLDANITRNVRLPGQNRQLNISVRVSNILSLANYSGINTNVNSPTFGQVSGVSGSRSATAQMSFRF